MKRRGILAVLVCVMAAGCGSDSPSSPSGANPNTITFTATLLPSNEVPPVSNAEASGRGTATITMNLSRNTAGAIQSGTLDFRFDLTGFPNGTTITLAHIHPGAAGATGAPVVNTGLTAATALVLVGGQGSYEARGIAVDVTALQAIIDNPAGYYFNVHSSTNPGGVARGQLARQ